MFGHASEPSRVYAYGARAPVEGRDAAFEALRLARRYRNDLVARERQRRLDADAIVRSHEPRLQELVAEIEAARAKIEALLAEQRAENAREKCKRRNPERQDRLRNLRADLKGLAVERKTLAARVYAEPVVRERLAALDAADLVERKRLRAASGVHWGTYLTVEQGLSGIRSGAPPAFVDADWSGKLAVQVQKGATWDDLLIGRGQARIEPYDVRAPIAPTRGGRRSRRPWYLLRIPVLRGGEDGPTWCAIPFTLHRPWPADARIKWLYVTARRIGTRYEWRVQCVLARPAWARADEATAVSDSAVAINLGWRRLADGGLRAGYAVGSDGAHEEVVLSARHVDLWDHADSLRAIRDRHLDAVRARLVAWRTARLTELPADWLTRTATLAQWRSFRRFARLALDWRTSAPHGDPYIAEALAAWLKQDRHLADWEAAERVHAVRKRDDIYRRFAARLRWRYERVYVESGELWRTLRLRPADDLPDDMATRRAAMMASPGRLREILESGHPAVERVAAVAITQTCSRCGQRDERLDAAPSVRVTCAGCGVEEDQDRRAARNLLARGRANAAQVEG